LCHSGNVLSLHLGSCHTRQVHRPTHLPLRLQTTTWNLLSPIWSLTQENRVLLGSVFSRADQTTITTDDTSTSKSENPITTPHSSSLIGRYKRIRRRLRRTRKKHHHIQTTIPTSTPAIPSCISTDESWGDMLMLPVATTRIILQNINGIRQQGEFADAHTISEYATTAQATIVGITETNVDWKYRGTRAACRKIFQKYWQRVNIATSSSDHQFDRVYQPGGTATIIGSPWAGRSQSSTDSSGLGRWSVMQLVGRMHSKVAVITAYRATGTRNKGPFTAYSQQSCLLRQRDIFTPPEECFYRDLGKYIQKLRSDKTSIIIMMDANDSMIRPSSKFTKWVKEHELMDPHTYLHGTEGQPPTYIGGSTRIDYFLVSPDLIPYVSGAGIIPFNGYYESDHRALFIDVDLSTVLKGMPPDPTSRDNRAITSQIPWKVEKYQQYVHQECIRSQIFTRSKTFEIQNKGHHLTPALHKELDGLDAELTAIQLEAEQLCKAKKQYPWSPLLKQCNNRIRYWRLWIRELRRFKDYGALRASIEVDFDLPTSYPTLREAQK
jgi:hypothetical protein